jgi:hypothetical protein
MGKSTKILVNFHLKFSSIFCILSHAFLDISFVFSFIKKILTWKKLILYQIVLHYIIIRSNTARAIEQYQESLIESSELFVIFYFFFFFALSKRFLLILLHFLCFFFFFLLSLLNLFSVIVFEAGPYLIPSINSQHIKSHHICQHLRVPFYLSYIAIFHLSISYYEAWSWARSCSYPLNWTFSLSVCLAC